MTRSLRWGGGIALLACALFGWSWLSSSTAQTILGDSRGLTGAVGATGATGAAGATGPAGSASITTTLACPVLISDPAAPATGWLLYCKDAGSGKAALMVRFPTGAVQQIAVEP